MQLHVERGMGEIYCTVLVEALILNTAPHYKQTDLLNLNKENNTIMKLLTYKMMPNILSWLRVTKKYWVAHEKPARRLVE